MSHTSLAGVYFEGNAPSVSTDEFYDDTLQIYYLPGTTGWANFAANLNLTPVLWNPVIQAAGMQNNQFGFAITGTNNFTVVVEACTNLANPVWTPISTNILTGGTSYFSDPQWTNYSGRYYRFSSQ